MTLPTLLELTFVLDTASTGRAQLVYATPAEGIADFHLTNWRRVTHGVLRGTLTHIPRDLRPDPYWEGYLEGLMGRVKG